MRRMTMTMLSLMMMMMMMSSSFSYHYYDDLRVLHICNAFFFVSALKNHWHYNKETHLQIKDIHLVPRSLQI